MTEDADPGDEDRRVIVTCPFCSRLLHLCRPWVTPLRVFEPDERLSTFEARVLDPSYSIDVDQLVTCDRQACRDEARAVQAQSFKSQNRKQYEAHNAMMRRRYDPAPGFKEIR